MGRRKLRVHWSSVEVEADEKVSMAVAGLGVSEDGQNVSVEDAGAEAARAEAASAEAAGAEAAGAEAAGAEAAGAEAAGAEAADAETSGAVSLNSRYYFLKIIFEHSFLKNERRI
jgi:hypothetical protein